VDRRGALLGPEESGPGFTGFVLGIGDCFFWVTVQLVTVELVAGAGSHQTAGGFVFWVCCFPGGGFSGVWWFGAGFPARILRTV
jgi:hypothetical protein